MNILGNKIQICITESEANIMQDALVQWRGPYSEKQIPELIPQEVERMKNQLLAAGRMAEAIQCELICREHAAPPGREEGKP